MSLIATISLFLICLTMSQVVFSAEKLEVLKIFSNKKEFVVPKKFGLSEGDKLSIKHQLSVNYAQVTNCKFKSCLARLDVGIFEMKPENKNDYLVEFHPQMDPSLYLGFGSPIGKAFRLGAGKKFLNNLSFGVLASRFGDKNQNSKISGNLISVFTTYNFYKSDDITVAFYGEIGWLMTLLEFKNDIDDKNEKENTYLVALGGQGEYKLSPDFSLGIKAGMSKNGLKSSYAGSNGTFDNPFSKPLVFGEIGIIYQF